MSGYDEIDAIATHNIQLINAGTGEGIKIDQDGEGKALSIDTEATTDWGINLDAIKFGMNITNAGTGEGLNIDQNGNGIALDIDSEATSKSAVQIDANINNDVSSLRLKHNGSDKFLVHRNTDVTADISLQLGDSYLWVDTNGDLRIHSAYPSGDLSGAIVGTQS